MSAFLATLTGIVLVFCSQLRMVIGHYISKSQAQISSARPSYFYMVEYCEIFKMVFSKILGFLCTLKIRSEPLKRYYIVVMTAKVKTVIESYLLLPDF